MNIQTLYFVTGVWIAVALVAHVLMFYVTAPFGRHTSAKWGPLIDNKLGWMLMESPSLLVMLYFFCFGSKTFNSWVWILFVLWIFHYLNRTLFYPLRIKPTPKKMPLVIAASAIFFNLVNAGLNGYYLAELAPAEHYNHNWLYSPAFLTGALFFAGGMFINWKSDAILIRLRKPGETGYKIPGGFLFKYVSSPNLFGEIVEWSGFALMAFNLPALSFMIWTYANLVPRAKNHHDWYLRHFSDYPKERKAVFPFLF